ncbi:hypothetical protein CYFUS_006994 [Cystobacter fuscus]|uniref:Tox-REase-5 domain-containing protein n=1 Tax=Cystobacter fuscus TaxID=43 RepID=A0A250JD78_9BACT|nr:Tox-REase-5 domain-containing protein [Cystobacter fuscus]ATB41528.1 hypothetical protein CYFUS_006994 [Cystobacter fuscus]
MSAARVWKWVALLLGMVAVATGCATASDGAFLDHGPSVASGRRGARVPLMAVAMVSPADMAVRAVSGGAVRMDAFDYLLTLAGLDNVHDMPSARVPLSQQEAARVLTLLMRRPMTPGSLPPRMAACHLLREVLEGGAASREELVRRVERFNRVAVLRPDGYLAWALNGRTQQKVGPVVWKDNAFRAGPFELGRFYTVHGWVFRRADARLRPIMDGPGLAEVYDDADHISRVLDGAEESFVELYHAMGQLLSHPVDSIAALRHLPAGVAALLASSPEYLARFRLMTRGEQVKALSKLTTNLLVTFGAAGGTSSTLTRTFAGAEALVPVLSLSAEGALAMERVVVPVGKVATVLSGGPGAAIILQRTQASGQAPSPAPGPGQWGPAGESMSARARAYQEQITGHSADDAYWVGGMSTKAGGVRFDGFTDGVLLEAKGPGYANKFFDTLEPKPWFKNTGAQALVDQARRQLGAVRGKGISIRWHIAEEKTAEAIRLLFEKNNVSGIEVVYTQPL